jgi:hypothetical protein
MSHKTVIALTFPHLRKLWPGPARRAHVRVERRSRRRPGGPAGVWAVSERHVKYYASGLRRKALAVRSATAGGPHRLGSDLGKFAPLRPGLMP